MSKWLASLGLPLVLGVCVDAQNGSQFRDWKPTALADERKVSPRAACAAMVSLTGYEFSVTTATSVPASADAPEFCKVSGQILPEVRFEVNLPAAWNGRLYMFGNGGYAGESLEAQGRAANVRRAVARGFAVAQTNTGHDASLEPLGTFAVSPQKFLDYAYRAVHVTAMTAKRVVQAYYDQPATHSYFDGCSTGGRQGLISAQRFPEDFDGIVVGAPVLDFTGTMMSYVTSQRALAAASLTAPQVKVLSDAITKQCDAVDGVADGVIDDPRRCTFDPSTDLPRCHGDAADACFTPAQVDALATIYAKVNRGKDADPFPGWPVGTEGGWIPWFIATPNASMNGRPIQVNFGETFFRYMAFGRANPSYDWLSFNADAEMDKVRATLAALDATDPDLTRFKSRGGRIVSYFGWADPALNPMMGVGYYERVRERFGLSTAEFYRLFMVPGMYHCSGGVGASTFDALTPLVEWVERGHAPAVIAASRVIDGKVVRTRPLCPYPQVARYNGTGSIDEAANFTCSAQ